jgi:hypothetical protein
MVSLKRGSVPNPSFISDVFKIGERSLKPQVVRFSAA